jgi:hypothetical protein
MSPADRAPGLLGRRRECAALDRLVADARAGSSRALVVRGDAGVGKSALLEYLARRASGARPDPGATSRRIGFSSGWRC